MLLLFLVPMVVAELCSNQCDEGEGDWCGQKRRGEEGVSKCQEYTRWEYANASMTDPSCALNTHMQWKQRNSCWSNISNSNSTNSEEYGLLFA